MAMKKAELEAHQTEYGRLMAEARSAEREGLYRAAVKSAIASWPYIDGMMQYTRRYQEQTIQRIQAIDIVLKYAPVLLDFRSLDALDGLLRETRRIERDTSTDLGSELRKARELMWRAHRLWGHIELNPRTRQDELRRVLGGDQDEWRGIVEAWEKMGLLSRISQGNSYCLAFSTRMGEVVPGKCPSCGAIAEAPKAALLQETTCPECQAKVTFVLLSKKLA